MTTAVRQPKNRLGRWMGIGTGVGAAAGLVLHNPSSVIVGLVAGIVVGSGLYAWEDRRYKHARH